MQNVGKWRGDRVESARNEKGLSPTSVAASVGVTAETIRRWERGEGSPDAEKLAVLATTLGVSLDYLLNFSDEPVTI